MSRASNCVTLRGHLTRDPELSYTANTQTAVCKFTIAVNRPRRNGQDQGADFIRITAFGRQAETGYRYLTKGREVSVLGEIQTGSYKGRDGNTVYTFDVVADNVEFHGSGNGNGGQNNNYGDQQPNNGNAPQAPQNMSSQAQNVPNNIPQQQAQPAQMSMDVPDTFQAADDDIPF